MKPINPEDIILEINEEIKFGIIPFIVFYSPLSGQYPNIPTGYFCRF